MSIESDPLQGSLQHEIIAQVGEMFAVRTDSKNMKRLPSVSFTLVKTELKDGPLLSPFSDRKNTKRLPGFCHFKLDKEIK